MKLIRINVRLILWPTKIFITNKKLFYQTIDDVENFLIKITISNLYTLFQNKFFNDK